MKQNEKAECSAKAPAQINNLTTQPTMKNLTPKQFQLQPKLTDVPVKEAEIYQSRRGLLESTKLSRLPKLADRPKFELPNITQTKPQAAGCLGCGGRLDPFDQVQESIRACRKCLQLYAKIETAFDEKAKRDKRQLLEKFVAEVKR
ncbi:MAG: hypothetical protein LC768_14380 [Acidobacteria bacterium]|nr:hypothetical protein [Acidobacteriota bacterium]MCA1639497.1 hypothetical protein [Acidobacteriota bacterium]